MRPTKIMAALAVLLMTTVLVAPAASADTSGSVDLTANILEPKPEIAIELNLTAMSFGELYPGDTSSPQDLKITNAGLKEIDVTATASDDGSEPLFVPGLLIAGAAYGDYASTLTAGQSDDTQLALHIPDDYLGRGDVSGGATFWAEEHSGSQGATVLYDGAVTLTKGATYSLTASNSPHTVHDVDQATDLGGLIATGLSMEVDDTYFATYGSYSLSSIAGVANDNGNSRSWFIVINGVPASLGLGVNALQNGDELQFMFCPYDAQYNPILDQAEYLVDVHVTVQSMTETALSMFHGDQQLTGYYSGDAPDSNVMKWVSDDINCVASSSVTVGEGKLFVYCFEGTANSEDAQGYIVALDIASGKVAWKEPTTVTNKWGSWGTPVYADGLVFTSGDGARYASNGTLLWSGLADGTNGSPLVADGKVYMGDWAGADGYSGGSYYCYDEMTGALLWTFSCNGGYSQGTPAYDDGKVFLTSWTYNGENAGYLYCVNANTGKLIWTASSGTSDQSFCGSPCISGGYVYVTSYNFGDLGALYCFNEANGAFVWKQAIERTDSTPAVYDGKVYVTGGCYGFSDHGTYCFDAKTGALIWSTTADQDIGGWTCSVVIADGKVFVGREGAWSDMAFGYIKLFALDANTGNMAWEADNGGSTVAIHDGVLFTAGADGKVYAYGA